jgi:hypothetical protein
MCDGEDRVEVVKKKAGSVVKGGRRCYKARCVSPKCTNGSKTWAKPRGERLAARVFRGREGQGPGKALLGSGGRELRATVLLRLSGGP